MNIKALLFLFVITVFSNTLFAQSKKDLKLHKRASKKLAAWVNPVKEWNHIGEIKIDSIVLDSKSLTVEVQFNKTLSFMPVREDNVELTINSIKQGLGKKYRKYDVQLITDGQRLETLIPNYYRKSMEIDNERLRPSKGQRIPLVRRLQNEIPRMGLYNKNIALWHSHGWYYEAKLDRWEWQRARLFTTVEDIFPMTFVLPYLAPMLENAGANVFLPRERDTQIHEVIVDNDLSSKDSEIALSGIEPELINTAGFMKKDTLFVGENPFQMGSYLRFPSSNADERYLEYIPNFPANGEYAVYVSYQQSDQNISDAKYTVSHTGGKTEFLVNQQIGGGTWVYLGPFHFIEGKNPGHGAVRLSAQSNETGWITADAVRFGGGMGNIARRPAIEISPNQWSLKGGQKGTEQSSRKTNSDQVQWKTGQKPRYHEGARYYLQYSGAPDSLVYSLNNGKNDYNDDYQSRGEWVNYLMGAPNGPNKNRNAAGLNIPIDLSLAFHTDAGITSKDSNIGTLAIYSSVRDEGRFPNGRSKMVNRDMTDMIQSEVVHDIKVQFNPDWSRRGLWNKEYSEAWRPNVPAMLLELLSHQNLADMGFGHDPRFKFTVCRAIYKGMVKFLAFQNNTDYVIQPLPVDHFSIKRTNENMIHLSWEPALDSLEPSAVPSRYKVYKRVGNLGFDNGQIIHGNSMDFELVEYGEIYSFKVTAINEGGESFASEILSFGLLENDKKNVLVVNAFDRISAPAIIDHVDFAGIAHWDDEGVADKFNIGYIGNQYDFDRKSAWQDDDNPGWGASYGNMEGKLIPGNSFDNTIIHGKAIMDAGYSFISTSDEAFSNPEFDLNPYETIDLIFGEEKTTSSNFGELFTVFDKAMQTKITEFTSQKRNVFVSGAYVGSDFILNEDTIAQAFANDILHFQWRTNHAVKSGEVYVTDNARQIFNGQWNFNTNYHPAIYKVEAPDAIEPKGEGAISAFRYGENNTSAGTIFNGDYKTVVMGFPFETIIDEKERLQLMGQILKYFNN